MQPLKSFWRMTLYFSLASWSLGPFDLWAAGKPDVYDLAIWKFKPSVNFEQGKKAAEELNAVLKKQDGFEKRHLYFDKTQSVWIDQIKWKHLDAAKKGRDTLQKDAVKIKLEGMIDPASAQNFQSERLFEVGT